MSKGQAPLGDKPSITLVSGMSPLFPKLKNAPPVIRNVLLDFTFLFQFFIPQRIVVFDKINVDIP